MSYKSVKDVVSMLQENGFVLKGQKGSHMKFEKTVRWLLYQTITAKALKKALITVS